MKKILYLLIFLLFSRESFAQSTTISPDRVSVPKMTTTAKNALLNKTEGMMVYDATLQQFSYWTGTAWANFGSTAASATGWQQIGNDISTTNTGYVGVGLSAPLTKFHLRYTHPGFPIGAGIVPYGVAGFESNIDAFVNLMSPLGFQNGLLFGSPLGNTRGGILYTHSANYSSEGLAIRTGGNLNRMVISANGNVAIGDFHGTSPLSFPNTIGNKISFWNNGPNSDYGIGIKSGTLALYTAGNDKISFGNGNANSFTEKVKIETGTGAIYSTQTPNLNIVPLGVIGYWVEKTAIIASPTGNFNNIAGNLVQSINFWCEVNFVYTSGIGLQLHLDPNVVSQYSRLVAINSSSFTGTNDSIYPNNVVNGYSTHFRPGRFVDGTAPYGFNDENINLPPSNYNTLTIEAAIDQPEALVSFYGTVIIYGVK